MGGKSASPVAAGGSGQQLGAGAEWEYAPAPESRDIVAELARGRDGATIARAGKIVLAWHRRRLVARQSKTRRHLRKLLAAEPFWRG